MCIENDETKAEIARQRVALLQFLETGTPVEAPSIRKCILARFFGEQVRTMFPGNWDTAKSGLDTDLFFPEAIEEAAESALDRFYDAEPGAFPYFDPRFEPHRPLQAQFWRIVKAATSLETKVTLLRSYPYEHDLLDHERVALFVCEELERPLEAGEDALTTRFIRLGLSTLPFNLTIEDTELETRLAQAFLALVFPHREEDLQGDDALNANYALRFYGSTLASRDIRGLQPFLEPKVYPWIKQTVLQIIQDLFYDEPPPSTIQWTEITKRVVTMAHALAHADVIADTTMLTLCGNAYLTAIILSLDPDLRLTKKLLACNEPALEVITVSKVEEMLEEWPKNPKTLPDQIAKLTRVCAALKSGFAKLDESDKPEPV